MAFQIENSVKKKGTSLTLGGLLWHTTSENSRSWVWNSKAHERTLLPPSAPCFSMFLVLAPTLPLSFSPCFSLPLLHPSLSLCLSLSLSLYSLSCLYRSWIKQKEKRRKKHSPSGENTANTLWDTPLSPPPCPIFRTAIPRGPWHAYHHHLGSQLGGFLAKCIETQILLHFSLFTK